MTKESVAGGVQSVERSALLLDALARAGGAHGHRSCCRAADNDNPAPLTGW